MHTRKKIKFVWLFQATAAVLVLLGVLAFPVVALSEETNPANTCGMSPMQQMAIRIQLEKKFLGAVVKVSRVNPAMPPFAEVAETIETSPGRFQVNYRFGDGMIGQSVAEVSAMIPSLVAIRRIAPGEALKAEYFQSSEIEISKGMGRELRGLVISNLDGIARTESRQTILEGTPLVLSSIQKIPTVRKGHPISIRFQSGGVQLSVPGTAEEPASIDQEVRVMTTKTKRNFTGKLINDSTVEVAL